MGGGGCIGQRLRLALAQIEMELRAEQSLSIDVEKGMEIHTLLIPTLPGILGPPWHISFISDPS